MKILAVCSILFFLKSTSVPRNETANSVVIIDSQLTKEEALKNHGFPTIWVDSQEIVPVQYYSFDNKLHQGQIVLNKKLVQDITDIFKEIKEAHFPIAKVIPIVQYNWSDDASIADNNTSSFNYRTVAGTKKVSDHAHGRAIDINPWLNPWVSRKGVSKRPYKPGVPGTIVKGDVVYKAFMKRGWKWGGDWKGSKDYQHFLKK